MSYKDNVKHITPSRHILTKIETPVNCPEGSCNKILISKSVQNLHFTQCHKHKKLSPNDDKDVRFFHCPVEGCIYYYGENTDIQKVKYFKNLKYLKQHFLKVHADRNFICKICNKKYATQSFLNAHLTYCDLQLKCSCGQDFSSIESILTHKRRTGHHANVLNIYFERIDKKKHEKSCSKKSLKGGKSRSSQSLARTLPTAKLNVPILPKPQTLEKKLSVDVALQRSPCVDVGVQTDNVSIRRLSQKCHIGNRECKRKQTTEMETQTHLYNKNKKRRSNIKNVSRCNVAIATNLSMSSKYLHSNYPSILVNGKDLGVYVNNNQTLPINSSATQTSPRGKNTSTNITKPLITTLKNATSKFDNKLLNKEESIVNFLTYDLCRPTVDASNLEQRHLDSSSCNDKVFSEGYLFFNNTLSDISLNPENLSKNKLSNIETQTEHDVFLSPHLIQYDIEETMMTLDKDKHSFCCTSETQTCEEFSDIERFLCSNIHTQTYNDISSTEELFPELNFSSDSQTQTDGVLTTLVTAHTQTSDIDLNQSRDSFEFI